MKKKLLVLLLVITVAAFLFTGCAPHVDPDPDPDPDPSVDGVLVEFAKEYREDNRVYVAGGSNTVTVTFPAPVTGMVQVDLSDCTGDYSKGSTYLFPVSEDRTVWEGSVAFNCGSYCYPNPCTYVYTPGKDCCATTVTVISGACEADTCIAFPVIVDCDKPYAKIEVSVDDCCCYDCAVTLKSAKDSEGDLCDPCGPTGSTCCGDDCSGLASWKVDIYSWDGRGHEPFVGIVDCCGVPPCLELIDSCEGADCPIECVTKCLDPDVDWGEAPAIGETCSELQLENGKLPGLSKPFYYYAVITLKDNVGNTQIYYAEIKVGLKVVCKDDEVTGYTCYVEVQEYCCVEKTGNGVYEWIPLGVGTTIGDCDGDYPCDDACH
jgi:hypothetical protein